MIKKECTCLDIPVAVSSIRESNLTLRNAKLVLCRNSDEGYPKQDFVILFFSNQLQKTPDRISQLQVKQCPACFDATKKWLESQKIKPTV